MGGCRICGGSTTTFLDLGRQPLSDRFPRAGATDGEFTYHLQVVRCDACATVQLADEVPREAMFTDDYPFVTSSSQRMVAHFEAVAEQLLERHAQVDDPFVVEIGSNDGTMLAVLAERGVRHLGVDPAGDPARRAAARGVSVLTDFFEERSARQVLAEHGPADVVYAANTLCHVPGLDGVFRGLDVLLAPDGVLVFEDPYLGDVVALGSFDQVYDEHFYLFSATSVARLAERWGFALVDVERLPVHGGEVRYTVARAGARAASPAVAALLREEEQRGLHDLQVLQRFASEVARRRDRLRAVLAQLREEGLAVAGYAATAKSATVLNYCGIDADLLPVVHDTTPAKQGRLTPGTHIPVEAFPPAERQPDVYLLLAWNHADEIMAKEQDFTRGGGRWLRYVPDVVLA